MTMKILLGPKGRLIDLFCNSRLIANSVLTKETMPWSKWKYRRDASTIFQCQRQQGCLNPPPLWCQLGFDDHILHRNHYHCQFRLPYAPAADTTTADGCPPSPASPRASSYDASLSLYRVHHRAAAISGASWASSEPPIHGTGGRSCDPAAAATTAAANTRKAGDACCQLLDYCDLLSNDDADSDRSQSGGGRGCKCGSIEIVISDNGLGWY